MREVGAGLEERWPNGSLRRFVMLLIAAAESPSGRGPNEEEEEAEGAIGLGVVLVSSGVRVRTVSSTEPERRGGARDSTACRNCENIDFDGYGCQGREW